MNRLLLTILAFVLAALPLRAEERERLWSDPALPTAEALERLNLQMAWHRIVPMESKRDGFVSVQHTGRQMLIQTRGGIVALLNSETGKIVWRVRIGDALRFATAPAFNSSSVFAVNGTVLYSLDRTNGSVQWQLSLPGGLSAPPLADEEQVYLFTGSGKVHAYRPVAVEVPESEAGGEPPPPPDYLDQAPVRREERTVTVVRPLLQWTYTANMELELPGCPVRGDAAGSGRRRHAGRSYQISEGVGPSQQLQFSARRRHGRRSRCLWRCRLLSRKGRLSHCFRNAARPRGLAAPDRYWRSPRKAGRNPAGHFHCRRRQGHVPAGPGNRRVALAIPKGNRLATSQEDAARFLASSPKFVYAADRSGRLLVIDRVRGLLLSRYDTRDFVVPVVNEQTDRLYLAANSGLLVCLRDRDYPEPQRQMKISEREKEAGKTLEERIRDMKRRLAAPVTLAGSDPQPLSKFLDEIRVKYGLKSFISKKSFEEAGNLVNPDEIKVKVPKLDNVPLGEALLKVLEPANVTYKELGDQVFVVPKVKPGK